MKQNLRQAAGVMLAIALLYFLAYLIGLKAFDDALARYQADNPPPPQTNYVAVKLTNTTAGFLKLARIATTNGGVEYVVSAAPELAPGFAPTNNTPVVNRTNTAWMTSSERAARHDYFSTGAWLGYAYALRGGKATNIDQLIDAFRENRYADVHAWLDAHPLP